MEFLQQINKMFDDLIEQKFDEKVKNWKLYLSGEFDKIGNDFSELEDKFDDKIDGEISEINQKIDNEISELDQKLDNEISELDQKIDELENKLDKIALLESKLDDLIKTSSKKPQLVEKTIEAQKNIDHSSTIKKMVDGELNISLENLNLFANRDLSIDAKIMLRNDIDKLLEGYGFFND